MNKKIRAVICFLSLLIIVAISFVAVDKIAEENIEALGLKKMISQQNNIETSTFSGEDLVSPIITLQFYDGSGLVESEDYVNKRVVAIAEDENLEWIYYKRPNENEYLKSPGGRFVIDTKYNGWHTFYAIDKNNNISTTSSVFFDDISPIGQIVSENGDIILTHSTNTNFSYQPIDKGSGIAYIQCVPPNTDNYIVYSDKIKITANSGIGWYTFHSYDKSGNMSSESTIYLDPSPIVAQLFADGKPVLNGSYTNAQEISFESSNNTLLNYYVKLPNATEFATHDAGVVYSLSGKYLFYAENEAGSKTEIFKIVIDRTSKPLFLNYVKNGVTEDNVVIDWIDGDADIFAPVKNVTINNKPYIMGNTIYTINTGVYNVICVDEAGNIWSDSFISNHESVHTKTINKEWWEATDSSNNIFSFESYVNALNFCIERELALVRTNVWNNSEWDTGIAMDSNDSINAVNGKYLIYKKSGDSKLEVAYFTEARLKEVIKEYAVIGIKSYFYWQKDPNTVASGNNLTQFSDGKTILSNSITLDEHVNFLIDGERYGDYIYNFEGDHILIAYDDWGNECEYRLIVVRNAPRLRYALGGGSYNTVTFDRDYYLKNYTTIGIIDDLDEFAMFYIFNDYGELIAMLNRDDTYTLSEVGKYVIQAVNHSGKSHDFIVYISLDSPTLDLKENSDKKQLFITITQSSDRYANLTLLEIYKSTDIGKTWVLLSADDYGKTIEIGNCNYKFRTNGTYKIVLEDNFRTGIDAVTKQLSYTQADPIGKLDGVTDGGYTNGSVSFTWKDEATVILTLNGKLIEYASGTKLTDEGVYTLTFKDYNGYEKVYTFAIDSTAPTAEMDGANNGDTVNSDVAVTFFESDLTVKLYKNGVLIGDYANGTVLTESGDYCIVLSDIAGNETELTFTIDKKVDFVINIYDNGLSNEVIIENSEDLTILLTKDGKIIEYNFGNSILASGNYSATITDKLGNTVTYNFIIVTALVINFEHNFDNVNGLEKVSVNGEEIRLNYGTMYINSSGTHTVTVTVTGVEYSFEIIVDNISPTINMSGVTNNGATKNPVIISDISEESTLEVYLNGEKIEYILGNELVALGHYKIILSDTAGNINEYNFKIAYSLNGGAVAIIVIAVLGTIGLAVGIILGKKGFYKKKHKTADEQEIDVVEDENQGEN